MAILRCFSGRRQASGVRISPSNLPIEQDTVKLPPMTDRDRMAADYVILGLSPDHHPMAFLRSQLHEGVVASRMLESLSDGTPVD